MDDGGKIGATIVFYVCLLVCVFIGSCSVPNQSLFSNTYDTYYNPTNQGLVSLSSKLQRHSDSSTTTTTKNDTKRKHKLLACACCCTTVSTARRRQGYLCRRTVFFYVAATGVCSLCPSISPTPFLFVPSTYLLRTCTLAFRQRR